MNILSFVNARLSRWAMYLAVAGLLGIVGVVVCSVFWRYILNDSPTWTEQVALLLAINVAMFGGAAAVRDSGHIGLESLTGLLPQKAQFWVGTVVGIISVFFGVILCWGALKMGRAVLPNAIPTLGISEFYRYLPCVMGGALVALFSIEHLVAMFTDKEVLPSWH